MRKLKKQALPLKGLFLITTIPHEDTRGIFDRIFCKKELEDIGLTSDIVQINHSVTDSKGSIRGMHFQYPPAAEIKMVRCLRGSVFDVVIDIRKSSPTFLQWHGEILSENSMKMLLIPQGFAHGFQTLEDSCEMLYLHTEYYSKKHESRIAYNDPAINIKWKLSPGHISEQDKKQPFITKNFDGVRL